MTVHREDQRDHHRTASDGLRAIGVHDTGAHALVESWFADFRRGPWPWRAMLIPDSPDPGAPRHPLIEIWTTPSLAYVGFGYAIRTSGWFAVDGMRLAARATRTHLQVYGYLWQTGGEHGYVGSQSLSYPTASPWHLPGGRWGLCPTCHQELPATGVCDRCA